MRTIIVNNTSLMRVAAEELGDSTRWVDICQLNGLVDPFIMGFMTVRLPPREAPSTRGIPG